MFSLGLCMMKDGVKVSLSPLEGISDGRGVGVSEG